MIKIIWMYVALVAFTACVTGYADYHHELSSISNPWYFRALLIAGVAFVVGMVWYLLHELFLAAIGKRRWG